MKCEERRGRRTCESCEVSACLLVFCLIQNWQAKASAREGALALGGRNGLNSNIKRAEFYEHQTSWNCSQ